MFSSVSHQSFTAPTSTWATTSTPMCAPLGHRNNFSHEAAVKSPRSTPRVIVTSIASPWPIARRDLFRRSSDSTKTPDCEQAEIAGSILVPAARDAHNKAVEHGPSGAVLATRELRGEIISNGSASDLKYAIEGAWKYLDLSNDAHFRLGNSSHRSGIVDPDCSSAFRTAAIEFATEGWSPDPTPQLPTESRSPYVDLASTASRSSAANLALCVALGALAAM